MLTEVGVGMAVIAVVGGMVRYTHSSLSGKLRTKQSVKVCEEVQKAFYADLTHGAKNFDELFRLLEKQNDHLNEIDKAISRLAALLERKSA